ncbi:hypothetical protein CHARACLAT_013049 [Characodon lateralis]|uniref:Secreted protein n=1 Tax=Characodon lateralis TaxID=208331 RepID=A0ABU7EWI2_9TELE|nr:hypothetical protein [Characodon lateralis]
MCACVLLFLSSAGAAGRLIHHSCRSSGSSRELLKRLAEAVESRRFVLHVSMTRNTKSKPPFPTRTCQPQTCQILGTLSSGTSYLKTM